MTSEQRALAMAETATKLLARSIAQNEVLVKHVAQLEAALVALSAENARLRNSPVFCNCNAARINHLLPPCPLHP